MSDIHVNARSRTTAVAGALALTLAVAATPALAQDDPSATIDEFLAAVEAKDFESLAGFFCEEAADQAGRFDISALADAIPSGVDTQALLDSVVIDVQLDTLETVSQDETEAVVRIDGAVSLELDEEALIPLVTTIVEMAGLEADEATIEMFMGIVSSEFESMSEDITGELTLVPGEERPWLICGDLGLGGDMGAEASPGAEGLGASASPPASPSASE